MLASVDETTIRRVSAGQPAQITFDAVPGQTLQGQVGDVPLQGTLQGGVMVYEVPISLVGAEKLPLLVGMTANVKIAVGAGGECAAGAGDGAAEGERDVPGAGAEHGGSGGAAGGGAGGGRAERRELHADRTRAERR